MRAQPLRLLLHGLADRLGTPLELLLDQLSAPEIAEWQAYVQLSRDENAFESAAERDTRFMDLMGKALGNR